MEESIGPCFECWERPELVLGEVIWEVDGAWWVCPREVEGRHAGLALTVRLEADVP